MIIYSSAAAATDRPGEALSPSMNHDGERVNRTSTTTVIHNRRQCAAERFNDVSVFFCVTRMLCLARGDGRGGGARGAGQVGKVIGVCTTAAAEARQRSVGFRFKCCVSLVVSVFLSFSDFALMSCIGCCPSVSVLLLVCGCVSATALTFHAISLSLGCLPGTGFSSSAAAVSPIPTLR